MELRYAEDFLPPREGARRYRDVSGRWWGAYEGTVGKDATCRCLIFESNHIVRRVREYPEDWRSLDDDALERLSWGR